MKVSVHSFFALALITTGIAMVPRADAQPSGSLWVWGTNGFGQMCSNVGIAGIAVESTSLTSGVTAVAAGGDFMIALLTDGTLRTCGSNAHGQLGNGTNVNSPTPVVVSGLSGVVAIAAGFSHGVALRSDGTIWTWGDGEYGQLGVGLATSNVPLQVGLFNVVKIAACFGHALALQSNGSVWAWGLNSSGQLGDGSTKNSDFPEEVAGLKGVTALAAGDAHSFALIKDGTAPSSRHCL
jgi:alpha-tubulin suppressor-like RCC1 family protein